MSPVERLITWLWDPFGDRRREQQVGMRRTAMKIRQKRGSSQRAIAQIKRTQEIARQVGPQ